MTYSKILKELFPETTLHAEDLLLLETFQIKYLPDRMTGKEFSALLQEYPVVLRFLEAKYPPVGSYLAELLNENEVADKQQIEEQCQEALWEIADLIIYNKHPELYDRNTHIQWDISEINSIISLDGKIVADVGAGSGRIAFMVAPIAQTVFAVEPITSFRTFMKEKAQEKEVRNLFVMDGTLDSIPIPDQTLDALITSNAIGWNLQEELKEVERVIKTGGHAIHLLQSQNSHDNPFHDILVSSSWNYSCLPGGDEEEIKLIYSKMII